MPDSSLHDPDPEAADRADVGAPRWVKVLGLATLALALLVILMLVSGVGGHHGPGRHSGVGPAPPIRDAAR